MYQVKRPSETRLKNGRRPAPTPTVAAPARKNPGLGPVVGSFLNRGKTKAATARADAKAAQAKADAESAPKKK